MVQFFQTRMGIDFFQGTVPKLIRLLETIAESYDANLRERVEVLELALSLPCKQSIKCKDGFSFILGIREPGTNQYYLSFPTAKDSLIEGYRDNPKADEAVSYSCVPAITVAQLIINHGGLNV